MAAQVKMETVAARVIVDPEVNVGPVVTGAPRVNLDATMDLQDNWHSFTLASFPTVLSVIGFVSTTLPNCPLGKFQGLPLDSHV